MQKFTRSLIALGALTALAACGDDVSVAPQPVAAVTGVTVSAPASIKVGQTVVFGVSVTTSAGSGTPSTAVTWTTGDATIASVNATSGAVTGVAAGSTIITATAGNGVSGSASITVTSPTVTSVTVSPSGTTQLEVGDSLTAVATVVRDAGVAGTVNWTSNNVAVATVGGTTGKVIAVAQGVAVITATSTVDPSVSGSTTVQVVNNFQAASVSIFGLQQGGQAVNLAGVNGQIEAILNINAGTQHVDSVVVMIDGVQATSQVYAINGAPPAQVSLSINTAVFDANYVPSWHNGLHTISAAVFPHGASTPTASNTQQFTLTNADVVYFDATGLTHIGNSATDGLSNTWWKDGFTYSSHPVNYSNAIQSIEYNSTACGAASGTVAPNFTATFDCAGVESSQNITNAITVTYDPSYTLTVAPTTFMTAASAGFVPGKPVFAVVSTNEDNVAPNIAVGNVAFNDLFDEPWVNASYAFAQDFTPTDGGVGVDGAASSTKLWVQGAPGSCSGAAATTGADLAETSSSNGVPDGWQVCALAADLLGNSSASGPSNFFGVDKVAPSVRLAGSTAATPALTGTSAATSISSTPNTTIYSIAAPFTATDVWGLEGIDDNSGFNQNVVAGFPATQTMGFLSPSGSLSCAGFTGGMGLVLSDNWVRTDVEEPLDCGSGLPGYYNYEGYVVDRAGNASASIVRNFAIDQYAAPVLSALLPASVNYTAGTPASFNVYGTDDLEILSADLTVTYPGYANTLTYPRNALSGAAPWDAFLNNVVTASTVTIPQWLGRVDATCTGAGAPYASCVAADAIAPTLSDFDNVGANTDNDKNPSAVTATAYDVGDNASAPSAPQVLSPLQTDDVAAPWTNTTITAWRILSTAGPFTAEAKSFTSVGNQFFDTVYLARIQGGTAVLCGQFPAPTKTDQGLTRFFTYSLQAASVSTACATGGNWLAIGIKGNAAIATVDVP